MRKLFFIGALLLSSVFSFADQQSARLGSHQSIAPLPKELTKDGKSYMVMAEYDSKGKEHRVGLYDAFGPDAVKHSFDIPLVKLAQSYYEKASGYTDRVAMRNNYRQQVDYSNTYSTKSDVEAYVNRYIVSLSEFTITIGDNAFQAFRISSGILDDYSKNYYYNPETYGIQYPTYFFAIDDDGHLMQCYANYWENDGTVIMGSTYSEPLDQENTYSSKEDIEYYFNHGATAVQVTEFTTPDGITAYYVAGEYSHPTRANVRGEEDDDEESMFWNYEKYGTKYPYHFYYIENGWLMECYPDYYIERDLTNAIWTIDPDFSSDYYDYDDENYYQPNMAAFYYVNVDNSFYPTTRVLISQNLFNADDNWEFISFDIEFEPRDTTDAREYEDGEVRRKIYLRTIFKAIKIINEAGAESFYLPLPNKDENEWTSSVEIESVSVLNGLLYILTTEYVYKNKSERYGRRYEGIYSIDPKDASVRAITRSMSRLNLNSTVIDKGESLDIQISGSGKDDNLTISSMSGQIINSSNISEENPVSVNTGAMPKGIYNVTLRGNGNPTENQRIIIK